MALLPPPSPRVESSEAAGAGRRPPQCNRAAPGPRGWVHTNFHSPARPAYTGGPEPPRKAAFTTFSRHPAARLHSAPGRRGRARAAPAGGLGRRGWAAVQARACRLGKMTGWEDRERERYECHVVGSLLSQARARSCLVPSGPQACVALHDCWRRFKELVLA